MEGYCPLITKNKTASIGFNDIDEEELLED